MHTFGQNTRDIQSCHTCRGLHRCHADSASVVQLLYSSELWGNCTKSLDPNWLLLQGLTEHGNHENHWNQRKLDSLREIFRWLMGTVRVHSRELLRGRVVGCCRVHSRFCSMRNLRNMDYLKYAGPHPPLCQQNTRGRIQEKTRTDWSLHSWGNSGSDWCLHLEENNNTIYLIYSSRAHLILARLYEILFDWRGNR